MYMTFKMWKHNNCGSFVMMAIKSLLGVIGLKWHLIGIVSKLHYRRNFFGKNRLHSSYSLVWMDFEILALSSLESNNCCFTGCIFDLVFALCKWNVFFIHFESVCFSLSNITIWWPLLSFVHRIINVYIWCQKSNV